VKNSVFSTPVIDEQQERSLTDLFIHLPPHPWGVFIGCSYAYKSNDKKDAHSPLIPCRPVASPAEQDKESHRRAGVIAS